MYFSSGIARHPLFLFALGFETDQLPVASATSLPQSRGLNIFHFSLHPKVSPRSRFLRISTLLSVFISSSPTENKKRTDCDSLSPTHAFTFQRNPWEVCTFFLHCIHTGLFIRFTFNQVWLNFSLSLCLC